MNNEIGTDVAETVADAPASEVEEASEPASTATAENPEADEKHPLAEPIVFRKDGVYVDEAKVPGLLADSFTIRTVDSVIGKVSGFWAVDVTLYTNVEPEFDESDGRLIVHVEDSSTDSVTYKVDDRGDGQRDSEALDATINRLRRAATKRIPGSLRRPCSRCGNPCRPDAEKCSHCGEALTASEVRRTES